MKLKGELVDYKSLFPVLKENPDFIYLDNAATSLKPYFVINSVEKYMAEYGGSPNRGAYDFSTKATMKYDLARKKVASFIGAEDEREIIFTAGATYSLNMIASAVGADIVKGKKNIVVSISSHHSVILPMQRLANKYNLKLDYIYFNEEKMTEEGLDKIDSGTLFVVFPMVSNATGFVHDSSKIIAKAKEMGAITVVDAAQGVGHSIVDVNSLGADILVFSGHKMFSATGVGVLYAKYSILEKFEPYLLGGDMIEYVSEQEASFADIPSRFEAGTQNTLGVFTLLSAIEFIESIGLENIINAEEKIYAYAFKKLKELDFLEIITVKEKSRSIIAFNMSGIHPHDVATILNGENIAIRAGHHCAQPYMKYMNLGSSCRISLSFFNTESDIDKLIVALRKVKEIFGDEQYV